MPRAGRRPGLGEGDRTGRAGDGAAVARLGQLGAALLLDQLAPGEHARAMLGWSPAGPSMLEDIHREAVVDPRPLRPRREVRAASRPRLVGAR